MPPFTDRSDASLTDCTQVLRETGLGFLAGDIVYIAEMGIATRAYMHHTRAVVAAIGYAVAEPIFCRGRFPTMTLEAAVTHRSALDSHDAAAIARIAGTGTIRPAYGNSEQFSSILFPVIEKYGLSTWFYTDSPTDGTQRHYAVRPRGYGPNASAEIPEDMKAWRQAYRGVSAELQMMIATILWLYHGRGDSLWLKRLPHAWHIADAVALLRDKGMFGDWGRLVACYPGW